MQYTRGGVYQWEIIRPLVASSFRNPCTAHTHIRTYVCTYVRGNAAIECVDVSLLARAIEWRTEQNRMERSGGGAPAENIMKRVFVCSIDNNYPDEGALRHRSSDRGWMRESRALCTLRSGQWRDESPAPPRGASVSIHRARARTYVRYTYVRAFARRTVRSRVSFSFFLSLSLSSSRTLDYFDPRDE